VAPTSHSSQGSGDSTLPLSPSGSPASDRSSGTPTAPEFSNDTGPTFRDGETLLPTPRSQNAEDRNSKLWVRPLCEPQNLENALARLLPTPKAQEAGWKAGPEHADRLGHRSSTGEDFRTWGVQQVVDVLTSSAEGSPVSPSAPQDGVRLRTTSGGSGLSSPASFASLDPDGSWLRTYRDSSVQASLLGPLLVRFSGTWPRSGSLRGGIAFEHPTSERPIVESGSSSLPTPNAMDATKMVQKRSAREHYDREARLKAANPRLGELHKPLPVVLNELLHTPTTGDTAPTYDDRASPGYTRAIPVPNLAAQVDELLPTPTADHSRGLAQPGTDYQSLPNAVLSLGDLTKPPSKDGSE
jgi:hypothetical protein